MSIKSIKEKELLVNFSPAYEPDDGPLTEEQIVQIKETIDYPTPPCLDDLLLLLGKTK